MPDTIFYNIQKKIWIYLNLYSSSQFEFSGQFSWVVFNRKTGKFIIEGLHFVASLYRLNRLQHMASRSCHLFLKRWRQRICFVARLNMNTLQQSQVDFIEDPRLYAASMGWNQSGCLQLYQNHTIRCLCRVTLSLMQRRSAWFLVSQTNPNMANRFPSWRHFFALA